MDDHLIFHSEGKNKYVQFWNQQNAYAHFYDENSKIIVDKVRIFELKILKLFL